MIKLLLIARFLMLFRDTVFHIMIGIVAITFVSINLSAQTITSDNTTGTIVDPPSNNNNTYEITGGTKTSDNLFHSFMRFDLDADYIADFKDPGGDVSNILSRVTGENESLINGEIRSSIPGANLFLLNPHGIVFKEKAKINIDGSFYASTADQLEFADGLAFSATNPDSDNINLLVDPPQAFGFIDNSPASISVNGARLVTKPEADLSLVGGSIKIDDGRIEAQSGAVNIVSAIGPGRVPIDRDISGDMITLPRGDVTLNEFSLITSDGGNVTVIGRNVSLTDGSIIESTRSADEAGGETLIDASGIVAIRNYSGILSGAGNQRPGTKVEIKANTLELLDASFITTTSFEQANAGDIVIKVEGDILVENSTISVGSRGEGNAGSLSLTANNVLVTGGGAIEGNTNGSGKGADINITTDELTVTGKGDNGVSRITTESKSDSANTGNAGSIMIKAGRFVVTDEAKVSATTSTNGQGGSIEIEATDVHLRDSGSISAESTGTGPSGSIIIKNADTVTLLDNSEITVRTEKAEADAGNITINAKTLLHLRNNSTIETSAAVNDPDGRGSGGDITIDPKIVVLDGASRIQANAEKGKAGNIRITITDGGALFQSPDSVIEASAGPAGIDGTVEIIRTDSDVIRGTLVLPETFLDAAKLLSEKCMARTAAGASSFVVSGRAGVPPGPDALLPDYASVFDDELVGEQGDEAAYTLPVSDLGSTQNRLSRLIIECNPI